MRCTAISIFGLLIFALGATPARPVRAVVEKADKTRLAGDIKEFDSEHFVLVNDRDQTFDVRWEELSAKNAYALYARLIDPASDAEQWIDLGTMMLTIDDGADWADKAFARALKIDPSLKERIDQVKEAAKAGKSAEDGASSEIQGQSSAAVPQTVGEVEDKFWGKLSDDEMKAAIAQLKAFGDETRSKINDRLQLVETQYFLFYSDLPSDEARRWSGLLDRMYARLCELFAVPKDTNIWRGKCLIFVFRKQSDYARFQQEMHHTDAEGTAGMCHNFGDGTVHIAFYRQPQELIFAHVLVHESVHGFLHRYRKPPSVPSWANEGLAEVIGAELVPNEPMQQLYRRSARAEIEARGGLDDDFFFGSHIQPWHYPVARTLCEMMIRENKKGYVAFINGMKDGMDWQQSLKEKYGTDVRRLVDYYYDWLGVQRKRLRAGDEADHGRAAHH